MTTPIEQAERDGVSVGRNPSWWGYTGSEVALRYQHATAARDHVIAGALSAMAGLAVAEARAPGA